MRVANRPVEGHLKLSELRPCAACGGPLIKRPCIQWYVVRQTTAMLVPMDTNRVLGLTQFFQGHLGLAETFETSKPVHIMGDHDAALLTELHVCLDCWASPKFDGLRVLLEKAERLREERTA